MPPGGVSVKVKDALLRRRFTDRQIGVAYDYLTRTDHDIMGGVLGLATYGGRVNSVAARTRPRRRNAARSSTRHATRAGSIRRTRRRISRGCARSIRELFAETGGVPVPGDAYEGSLINHPDADYADASLNSSGVPWHALYYNENYPLLQQVKARWDPRNVFKHALSIRLP